jgi:hypothetical protein
LCIPVNVQAVDRNGSVSDAELVSVFGGSWSIKPRRENPDYVQVRLR